MNEAWLIADRRDGELHVEAGGACTVQGLAHLDRLAAAMLGRLRSAGPDQPEAATLALDRIERLDTAGAWLLHRLAGDLEQRGFEVHFEGVRPEHGTLIAAVRRLAPEPPPPDLSSSPLRRTVEAIGRSVLEVGEQGASLLSFLGATVAALGRTLVSPRRLRFTSLISHLEQSCLNALPIVGLISFLIGVVLAYQGADQLRRFGADIFTVNLLAVSVLREIGILLTAIVVAGRSGSAFTAQIGTMKVNEEVDALRTLGLDPIEVLVLPRVLALMIALPLLGVFADLMGLLGGGIMATVAIGIPSEQFLNQLESAATPAMFAVGLIKAPVFAFLIAIVGCYEGLSVSGSAESVGRLTTRSVVTSIFLVIVADAIFSILFSILGV